MKAQILKLVDQAKAAIALLESEEALFFLESFVHKMEESFEKGGKVLVAGNGGSLCDAMHFAEELTGFFRAKRPPFAALALNDPGHMSCVANDVGFQFVFERLVTSLGRSEDLLLLLSTSGRSENLLLAAKAAKAKGIFVVSLLGKGGGELALLSDLTWVVPHLTTSDRIQEVHMALLHMAVELVEEKAWRKSLCCAH